MRSSHELSRNDAEQLIAEIKRCKDREFVTIPDFDDVCGVDLNEALGIFSAEKRQIRNAANDLWLLAGKIVVVRRERGGNTVLCSADLRV